LAEYGGCGFHLENYALRPAITLDDLDGGRIHVDDGEIQADDTLSEPGDESLCDGNSWSLENDQSGAMDFWLFRDLDMRFHRLSLARFRVELTARVVDIDGKSAGGTAVFEVDAT
jgi:hypothetical protein